MTLNFSLDCDPVDALIADPGLFDLGARARDDLIRTLAAPFLAKHREGSSHYGRWCERAGGLDPLRPETFPSIPTTVFKAADVLSTQSDQIEKWCLSSGTQGVQSRVGRDRQTLDRLVGALRAGLSLIRQWDEEELQVVHLGPDNAAAGDVWFPYVMSLAELLYPTEHLTIDGRLDLAAARALIEDSLAAGRHVGVIGAPHAVMDLCAHAQAADWRLAGGERISVVTGGGWKRRSGEALAKPAFRRRVAEVLGLGDDRRVRDAFNQVELNSVILECEHHRMHVPPWVYAFTRDPHTLEAQPPGQDGLLAFVDFSVSSYPCSIVGDDLGRIDAGGCPCGRAGPILSIARRVERGFQRGCALALEHTETADV